MLSSVPGLLIPRYTKPSLGASPPPVGPSTPTPGAPKDGPRLDDYKPSILSYGKLAAYPLVGAGAGVAAGYSTTASIIAGVVTGGTLGLMAGAGIGLLLDLIHLGSNKSHATGKLAFVGTLVGAVGGGWGASLLPHTVTGAVIGVAGLALGVAIANVARGGLGDKVRRKLDDRTMSGSVHLSRLFRELYDKHGKGDPKLERDVRALEVLEKAGWSVGTTESSLEQYLTARSTYTDATLTGPKGARQQLPLESLATLVYMEGLTDGKDLDDPSLADAVRRFAAQGRPLCVNDYRATTPSSGAEEASVRLAAACTSLAAGRGAAYVHDGVPMHVDARDAATLEAAMKTVDDLVAQYDKNLVPAFKAGQLSGDSKARVFETLLKTPYGSSLDRSVPLLVKLAGTNSTEKLDNRTWSAVTTLETLIKQPADRLPLDRAVDDTVELMQRMPREKALGIVGRMREALSTVEAEKVDRYHDAFMRILRSTGDRDELAARAVQILTGADGEGAELQVSTLEKLASAASAQKDYKDIILDQATVMAARGANEPLRPAVERYASLLGSLAAQGKAEEAAPTYAFMKAAVRDGRARTSDEDALLAQALSDVKGGATLDAARASMLKPGADSGTRDVEAIEKRLADKLDAGTVRRAAHLFSCLPQADVEAHVGALESLAKGASYQSGYNDLLLDYATLMALRDPAVPLGDAAQEYSGLLSAMGSMKKAAEAAPTYAFIRSGMLHGRFGTQTFEQLSEKLYTALLAGADPQRARQSLLATVPSADNTVQKDDKVVIIGGVAVPIKH
jgi:hypothetical protein